MYKKLSYLIFGIIILFGIFLSVGYGGYYNTPEEALKHFNDDENSVSTIIETIFVGNEPVTFYVSQQGDLCAAEYIDKRIFNTECFKAWSANIIDHTKEINPNEIVPTDMWIRKSSNENPNRVFFGITRSEKAKTILINGKKPIFKSVDIDKQNYTLWYIIGSTELDKPSITHY